jgi:hypothetical protein
MGLVGILSQMRESSFEYRPYFKKGAKSMLKSIIFAVFITLAFASVSFSANNTIGFVNEVKGQAYVLRDG